MSGETSYRLLSVRYTHTHEKNHPNGGFSPNFFLFFIFYFYRFLFFLHSYTPSLYSSLLNTTHSFSSSHLPTTTGFDGSAFKIRPSSVL